MTADDCRSLAAHAAWADAQVWTVVLDLQREDPELREKLHHLHLVQWAYLQIWRGDPVDLPEASAFAGAPALCDWARAYHRDAAAYLAGMAEARLAEDVRFPWADRLAERFGRARPTTFAESAQQVALHSTYHRGQVARRLREVGAEPPLTDYIAWIWFGRPAAHWEGAAP